MMYNVRYDTCILVSSVLEERGPGDVNLVFPQISRKKFGKMTHPTKKVEDQKFEHSYGSTSTRHRAIMSRPEDTL